MTPYSAQTIAGIHRRLDRALEAELDRLASASPAHNEDATEPAWRSRRAFCGSGG